MARSNWPSSFVLDMADPSDPCENSNGGCWQICNSDGNSVVCSCKEGFRLKADGKSCSFEGGNLFSFFVTDFPFPFRLFVLFLFVSACECAGSKILVFPCTNIIQIKKRSNPCGYKRRKINNYLIYSTQYSRKIANIIAKSVSNDIYQKPRNSENPAIKGRVDDNLFVSFFFYRLTVR